MRSDQGDPILLLALLVAAALTGGTSGQSGLFERLFAGAGAIAALAVGVLRRASALQQGRGRTGERP